MFIGTLISGKVVDKYVLKPGGLEKHLVCSRLYRTRCSLIFYFIF